MNEDDLLNIYFMCNVFFRLKQKLERVAIGGCGVNFPFRYCTPATIFVSCVRKGVNFPLTVPILSDTACASLYLCNCPIRFPLLHGKVSEHSKNIWCKVKGQSQNVLSGYCSHFKGYVWVDFERQIRILEITTWSLRLRLKFYWYVGFMCDRI